GGREDGGGDGIVGVALGAFAGGSDVLPVGTGARLHPSEPQPPARDGADEPGAGLGTQLTDLGTAGAVRDENLAVSLGGTLGPRDREDDRIGVRLVIGICRSEVRVVAP